MKAEKIIHAVYEVAINENEIVTDSEEKNQVQEVIKNILDKLSYDQAIELDNAIGLLGALETEEAYKKGFQDGARLIINLK